ncbi:glycosyltransferase [Ramlibacter sp. USB13]|uniref:Glycosyltransferase n=1 Tax=Ramlibacter cellulosilyticus TaxID=2764187 RepID=A0A923MPD9_9BURK|nr:glycosyltransferase [Ramlibacter cellulosilyticus]MBC5782798.1 glycosyltransferase [Ramlibacter cellulosilyticus]
MPHALVDSQVRYVHEWLTEWGGSEDVTRAMLQALPGAALHATIDFLSEANRAKFGGVPIRTTFLQQAPWARTRFWNYLPVTPLAVETHDLRGADVIVSSSHAFAKGVLTTAEQMHVSYVHSPMRYAWDLHHEYLADYRLDRGAKGLLARYMFHRLRQWDRQTANNVDLFLANSRHVQRRIWRTYRRVAQVLYPPVSVSRFRYEPAKGDHYVTVSRLVSYKRIDLLLAAFRAMPSRKLVVVGDGPEMPRLRAMCPPNVQLMGFQDDAVVQEQMGSARAFLFAAHEDFGISPVEAQACGTPVIAYGVGGSRETVRDLRTEVRPTGLLFDEQTPAALQAAVEAFDGAAVDPRDCRRWAEGFDEAVFRDRFRAIVEQAWSAWRRDPSSVEAALVPGGGLQSPPRELLA